MENVNVQAGYLLWGCLSDLFDVHAALGAKDDHGPLDFVRVIHDDARVILPVNVQFFLHQDLFHREAFDFCT